MALPHMNKTFGITLSCTLIHTHTHTHLMHYPSLSLSFYPFSVFLSESYESLNRQSLLPMFKQSNKLNIYLAIFLFQEFLLLLVLMTLCAWHNSRNHSLKIQNIVSVYDKPTIWLTKYVKGFLAREGEDIWLFITLVPKVS